MRTPRLNVIAVTTAVLGLVVSMVAAWPRQDHANPTGSLPGPPPSALSPAPSTRAPGTDKDSPHPEGAQNRVDASIRAPSQLPRPVDVAIPAIDYAAGVTPVGVTSAGDMSLPADPATLGWYKYGPSPDAPGSTVLAGHLDSVTYGVGPLVRLRDVRPGDRVDVTLTDGRTDAYVVVAIDRYSRTSLPDELFARTGPRRLLIITCGGEYDANAGGYQLNLVVTAAPT
jgi:hypothetical protein